MNVEVPHKHLRYVSLGIDNLYEHVAFMHVACPVCISEGFSAHTRVQVGSDITKIVASIQVIHSDLLQPGEIGLTVKAAQELGVQPGDMLSIYHLSPVDSLGALRGKIYGNRFDQVKLNAIIQDIVDGRYSNMHLAAFITACACNALNPDEVTYLTRAMITRGESMHWGMPIVADKHCIGGLPGNRTTPIVVAIAAAAGLTMPKTSSRAITSPAGTADTMEVMCPVNLSMDQIKVVVAREGACVVWGATANLSPADDILIQVERALDIDSEGQLVASVLSKKVAAGATHVVIDLPVGKTAKLRTLEAATNLKALLTQVAEAVGLKIKVVLTDGSQPVGRGIGPALEAQDVLAVLRNVPDAPQDLAQRALLLAGELLELTGHSPLGLGHAAALEILQSGRAWTKFHAICEAQGGFTEPGTALWKHDIRSQYRGTVTEIENRKLAKVAKLAGAPEDALAGILFQAPIGRRVAVGDVLYTICSSAEGQLAYALEYVHQENGNIIHIEEI